MRSLLTLPLSLFYLMVLLTYRRLGLCKIVEKFNINIWAERHRSVHTEYYSLNTRIQSPVISLNSTLHPFSDTNCKAFLKIPFCGYHGKSKKICIFQQELQTAFQGIFSQPEAEVDMAGTSVTLKTLHELTQPITGYVVSEPNSVVKGYLIKKQFYGTIRMYDKYRLYHVVYYVEPFSVVSLYNSKNIVDSMRQKPSHNAVIFEYVSKSDKAIWIPCGSKMPPIPPEMVTPPQKIIRSRGTTTKKTVKAPAAIAPRKNIKPPFKFPGLPIPGPVKIPIPGATTNSQPSNQNVTVGTNDSSNATHGFSNHSTESYQVRHSTAVPPLTGLEFGIKVLGHSTDVPVTTRTFLPPNHSTTGIPQSPFTLPHSTTLFPLGHSTPDSTTTETHSTELTHPDHSTPEPRKFVSSTEVTWDPNAVPEPPTTTPWTLDPKQFSTEVAFWPYHSTEISTVKHMTFSTEMSPIYVSPEHSTEPSQNPASSSPLSTSTTTLNPNFLNHSTAMPGHSTDITKPTTTTTVPNTTLDTSIKDLQHSTDIYQAVHSTQITTTATTSHTTIHPRPVVQDPAMRHSTAAARKVHSTELTTLTTAYPTKPPKDVNFTGTTLPPNVSLTALVHSTTQHRAPFHSTQMSQVIFKPMKGIFGSNGGSFGSNGGKFGTLNDIGGVEKVLAAVSKFKNGKKNTTGLRHSTALPHHSTEASRGFLWRGKRELRLNDFFMENDLEYEESDVAGNLPAPSGVVDSNIFDIRSDKTYICELCVWIQPHFAENFGLGGGLLHGVAEVIDLIQFANQIFRAIDFNQDGIPENIGFKIKSLILTDEVTSKREKRKKREYRDDGLADIFDIMYGDGDEVREKRENFDFQDYMYYDKYEEEEGEQSLGRAEGNQVEELVQNLNQFKRKAEVVRSEHNILTWIEAQLKERFPPDCCLMLGFLYHDLAPDVSTTTQGGLCAEQNLALISGLFHSHKLTKYDVFRGIMHSLGHLFGSTHSNPMDPNCFDKALQDFINPFPLQPGQELNVGLRPNSMRFSSCSKDSITMHLSSTGAACLKEDASSSFCGNGVKESGEECDCGSLWQCHLRYSCCGEADSMLGCRHTIPAKSDCHSPTIW